MIGWLDHHPRTVGFVLGWALFVFLVQEALR